MTATVWDFSSASNIGDLEFDTTSLILTSRWKIITVAIDLTNNKIWVRDPYNGYWNNSATANPATNTGGYVMSGLGSAPYFPTFSGADATDVATYNFGAQPMVFPVSGFSTVNAAAGASVTLDPSNKSADITLSNGNLTAAKTGNLGSFRTAKATHSISSGAFYFDVVLPLNAGRTTWGIANASAPLTGYAGSDTNGISGYAGNNGFLFNSAFVGPSPLSNTANMRALARGTNSIVSGSKRMFEVRMSDNPSAKYATIGVCNSSAAPLKYVGEDANAIGWSCAPGGGTIYKNGSGIGNGGTISSGQWAGVYLDDVNGKVWFYNPSSGLYNGAAIGTENPATNTGGLSTSGLGALFPAAGHGDNGGMILEANFAGPFSGPTPSGFEAWDASGVASGALSATDPIEMLSGAGLVAVGGSLSATDPIETISAISLSGSSATFAASDPIESLSAAAVAGIAADLASTDSVETLASTVVMSGDLIHGAFTDPKETLLGHARVTGEGTRRPAVEILNQLLPPPRLTGDPSKDLPSLSRWCNTLWDHLTGTHNVLGEMDALVRAVRVAQGTQTNVATEFVRVLSEVEQLQQTLAGIIQSQEE